MGTQEKICGLCLKTCDNFKAVEGDLKDILDRVLPKINLTAIQELVICTWCTETLKECFHFKNACVCNYDYIVSFVNKDTVKLDLKVIYLSKNEDGTDVAEDQVICGLCLSPVKNCSAVSLDVDEGDVTLAKMIEQCLPELDFSFIEKPVVCSPCHGSLENCFRFMTNCLNVEEMVKKYCESMGISSRGQINLSSLLQFTTVASEMNDNSVDIIKEERQYCEESGNGDERIIDAGENIFKLEPMFDADSEIATEEDSNKLNGIKIEDKFCGETETRVKEENLFEMEGEMFLANEEMEIEADAHGFDRMEDSVVLPQDPLEVRMFKCDSCSYQTKRRYRLKTHSLVHKDSSEVTMYKCESCSFQTRHKNTFTKHLQVHKSVSEVTMYKCDSCSFQSRYRYSLKTHLLKHKDPSEITMYSCDTCVYQTKDIRCIKMHLLVHKNPSELKMHKCNSCPYQTKHKHTLKRHLQIHKNDSEEMYKCDVCSYQAKCKYYLNRHLKLHKNLTEYHCDSCSYRTKSKRYLKTHSLIHKDPSVIMHKCNSCSFQTKRKEALVKHLRVHKSPSEIVMYKCDSCLFQTKYKDYLKTHLLRHKNLSEVADC